MSNCISKFIEKFKPGVNLQKPDEEILNFGKQMLPKEIIELWEEYGFGEYGDGLLKVVDPREYMNSLYTWLGQKDFTSKREVSIPIIPAIRRIVVLPNHIRKFINATRPLVLHTFVRN